MLRLDGLEAYLRAPVAGGPVAVMICDDGHRAAETARHLAAAGFAAIIACGPGAAGADPALNPDDAATSETPPARRTQMVGFPAEVSDPAARARLLNRLIAAHLGRWMLVCFTGEFLFFPFSAARSVRDLTDFLNSERRASAMAYAFDLYGAEAAGPDFSLEDAAFDAEGWYAFERGDGIVDVFGGLGWRFEDIAPEEAGRVNRPALFHAGPQTRLREDLWLEDDSLNTIACPWHNNPTLALMSVRRARRLARRPEFAKSGRPLTWPHSVRFQWRADQLTALGMIEAGQWI